LQQWLEDVIPPIAIDELLYYINTADKSCTDERLAPPAEP
jgi:hypothetical protein